MEDTGPSLLEQVPQTHRDAPLPPRNSTNSGVPDQLQCPTPPYHIHIELTKPQPSDTQTPVQGCGEPGPMASKLTWPATRPFTGLSPQCRGDVGGAGLPSAWAEGFLLQATISVSVSPDSLPRTKPGEASS